jgi:hypothetical protein
MTFDDLPLWVMRYRNSSTAILCLLVGADLPSRLWFIYADDITVVAFCLIQLSRFGADRGQSSDTWPL